MSKPAVGIDLGTTYSAVAVYRDGIAKIVKNDQGSRTMSSCVVFTPHRIFVGREAVHQAVRNPENAIYGVKRLMGRNFHDSEIQQNIKVWPFNVVKENDEIKVEIKYNGKLERHLPEKISSIILEHLKRTAEMALETEVKDVVITCPANFNNSQRQATMDAAKLAGLNVIRMINEPTAAALAYGFTANNVGRENILIFDFGGGTCDISILTIKDKDYRVRATKGDTHLGGDDFDQRMVEYFVEQFKRKINRDISKDKGLMQQLKIHCEISKKILSFKTHTEFILDGTKITGYITRTRFEGLNYDLFKKAIDLVEAILKDADMTKTEIDEVVLVGGSSKIPRIREMLSEFFDGRSLNKKIDPDEAVALGAAIQAALIQNQVSDRMKGLKLCEVCPLSLGTRVIGGSLQVYIKRNTPIPVEVTETHSTSEDYQTAVSYKIFEGERKMAEDNHFLGEFVFSGIPAMLRYEAKVKLTFIIDENGILTVTAYESSSGNKERFTVLNNIRLKKDDAERSVVEAEKFFKEDAIHEERIAAFDSLYYHLLNLNQQISSIPSEDRRTAAKKVIDEWTNWLRKNELASKQEVENEKRRLEELWSKI